MNFKIFKNDTNTKFLPIVSALIVFLASLSLAIVFLSSRALNSWKYTIESSVSVQVMPDFDARNPESEMIERSQKVIAVLQKFDGIKSARVINKDAMGQIIKPWLHKDFKVKYTVFPEVIEVKTAKQFSDKQFKSLENTIQRTDKFVKLYKHEDWVKKAGLITRIFKNLAYLILAVSFIAMFGVISYSTKTSMLIQYKIVRLLNIMGAKDDFIARIFAISTARLCLIGGIVGSIISIPVLMSIIYVAQNSKSSLFGLVSLDIVNWILLMGLPILCFVIALISSYKTVQKTLKSGQ